MIPTDSPGNGRLTPYTGHRHFWQRALARREFIRASAGATALAMGAGLGLAAPVGAAPISTVDPNPIPDGILLGQLVGFPDDTTIYHLYFPAYGLEVSTVTDFNGVVAAAEVQGTGTGTDTSTGTSSKLYFDADMRFMQGAYRGVDGRIHQNTFAFIWLDLFTGPVGQPGSVQIKDFNPGIAPSGLFWTTFPFPSSNVQFNLALGVASMSAVHWAIEDYTDIFNSLGLVPPIPVVPATVSFGIKWKAIGPPTHLPNPTTPTTGFTGIFRDSSSQIAWSANEPAANFRFVSDPASTSTTISGVIGTERNGIFFPSGS